ncbi:hypothetical protein Tco_1281839 [Tanacetum coccineum]
MGELTFFLRLQVKTASTPIETQKPLVKDEEASDVDVHLYRSMIGSLMYLTASRPDIMFAVCACSRFQVTPKSSHLSAVKRIFRYLKGKPKLGLWYPRVSLFDLESYSDSDYAIANLDRKSTTGEYVTAASCCGQVLWIQNQMLDYGFNFMNTKIYIDNESTICIVKNPVYHSKTKHIAIRHHFIRDAYEKKLIQVLKIHTDDNVADLLTKIPGSSMPLTVSDQAKEIQHLKAQITKLKKQAKPVIKHHRAWMKSVSLKQRLTRKSFSKKQRVHKESVSTQGRKFAKENAQDEGRTRDIVDEDKEIKGNILSTEDVLSTAKETVSTDKENVSTDEHNEAHSKKPASKYVGDDDNNSIRSLSNIKALFQRLRSKRQREKKKIEELLHKEILMSTAKKQGMRPGNFKHFELKIKKFEEIQVLYKKIKRSDEDFISIGSAKDKRLIKWMNEKGVDSSKGEVIKEDNKEEDKEENKGEESTKKRKHGTRKKMKSRNRRYIQNTSDDDSEKENDELRLHLTITLDEEKEVEYEILDRKDPIKEWKTECLRTKPQADKTEHIEEINQNVVIRSNGKKRYFSTLMRVLSIFDREYLNAVYQLVMDRFQDEIPEGFDRILWEGYFLMVMLISVVVDIFLELTARLDFSELRSFMGLTGGQTSGVHTLVTEGGLVIHMLVEKKYPLKKEVLVQMLKLKLVSEEDSTMALELIRFIKKLLAELEPKE